jgi:L-aspartate oxidase
MLINTTQQGIRRHYDAIIIGGGIAGLTYALRLCELKPTCKIALITKNALTESNSAYAQGGIAIANNQTTRFAAHIQDTLAAGDGLCNAAAVKKIITTGPAVLASLAKYGVNFDHAHDTLPDLMREGGHSERRIYHYADTTGAEIIRALNIAVLQLKNITVLENNTAVNLITSLQQHTPNYRSEVLGVYVLENKQGLIHTLLSKITILATGGAGKVYRYTSNPDVATGDGIAMAYRVGAHVGNMEFYQFHPTLLYHPKIHNFLISETLRGEGAYLRLPLAPSSF